MRMLLTVLMVLWAGLLVLVGCRFLALLVGANPNADLVETLYDWSEPFVEPFFNIFSLQNKGVEDTGGTFEPASLIAFVVYLVGGMLVGSLISGAGFRRFRHA